MLDKYDTGKNWTSMISVVLSGRREKGTVVYIRAAFDLFVTFLFHFCSAKYLFFVERGVSREQDTHSGIIRMVIVGGGSRVGAPPPFFPSSVEILLVFRPATVFFAQCERGEFSKKHCLNGSGGGREEGE